LSLTIATLAPVCRLSTIPPRVISAMTGLGIPGFLRLSSGQIPPISHNLQHQEEPDGPTISARVIAGGCCGKPPDHQSNDILRGKGRSEHREIYGGIGAPRDVR